MFHVEQKIIMVTAAAFLGMAAAPLWGQEESFVDLAMASPAEDAVRHTNLGLQDLLLGWRAGAQYHFRAALQADPTLALASVALLQLERDHLTPEERKQRRQEIQTQLESAPATPTEAFYMNGLLQQLLYQRQELLQTLAAYTARYRADHVAACWRILLLHSSAPAYDEATRKKASPTQQEALALAHELYTAHPSDGLVCFTRAALESTAPAVSAEALQAAQQATELLPEHPMPSRLYGHLLYRSHESARAADLLARSARQAHDLAQAWGQADDALALESLLYEATARWVAGQDRASLRVRRAIAAHPLTQGHGEAATLPLRVLVGRAEPPTAGEVNAAYKVATERVSDAASLELCKSLHQLLQIRRQWHRSRRNQALLSLEQWGREHSSILSDGAGQGTALNLPPRYQQALRLAWACLQAEVYPASAVLWHNHYAEWNRVSPDLLPDLIPTRSASLDPQYAR